jgi:hypothetical protein
MDSNRAVSHAETLLYSTESSLISTLSPFVLLLLSISISLAVSVILPL